MGRDKRRESSDGGSKTVARAVEPETTESASAASEDEQLTDTEVGDTGDTGGSGMVAGRSGTPTSGQTGGPRGRTGGGSFVAHDPGPNAERQAQRYGVDITDRDEAVRIRRLESEHGSHRVQRWAEEGIPVAAMGKPRDMRAFRERQDAQSGEPSADFRSVDRASAHRDSGEGADGNRSGDTGAPDVVRDVVSSPGRSMNDDVQRDMESRMGRSLDHVQIHTGKQAARASDSIDARAFTVGNHIAFNDGEYAPDTTDGKKTLAHEITHTFQQTDGKLSMLPATDTGASAGETFEPQSSARGDETGTHGGTSVPVQPRLEVSSPDDPAEKEARQIAEQVVETDVDESDSDPVGDGARGERQTPNRSDSISRSMKVSQAGLSIRQTAEPVSDPSTVQRAEGSSRSASSGGATESLSTVDTLAGKDLLDWAEDIGGGLNELAPNPGDMCRGKIAVNIPIKLGIGGTVTLEYQYTAEKKLDEGEEEGHELNLQGKCKLSGSVGVGYAKTLGVGLSAGLGLKSALTVQAANGVDAMEQLLSIVYEALLDVIKGIKQGIPNAAQSIKEVMKSVLVNWGKWADEYFNSWIPDWIQSAANSEFAIAQHLDAWIETIWTGMGKGSLFKLASFVERASSVLKEAAEFCWEESKPYVPMASTLEYAVDPVGLTKSAIETVETFTKGLATLEDEGVEGFIDTLTTAVGTSAQYYVDRAFGGGRPEPLTEWGADEFVQGSLGVETSAVASGGVASGEAKLTSSRGTRIEGTESEGYTRTGGKTKVSAGVPNLSVKLKGGISVRDWDNPKKETVADVYGGFETTAPGAGPTAAFTVDCVGGAAESLAEILEDNSEELPGESELHEEIKGTLQSTSAVADEAIEPADLESNANMVAVKATLSFTDGAFNSLDISVLFGNKVNVPAGVVQTKATEGTMMKFTYDGTWQKKTP